MGQWLPDKEIVGPSLTLDPLRQLPYNTASNRSRCGGPPAAQVEPRLAPYRPNRQSTRISTLSRCGASGPAWGSRNAVCGVQKGRFSSAQRLS